MVYHLKYGILANDQDTQGSNSPPSQSSCGLVHRQLSPSYWPGLACPKEPVCRREGHHHHWPGKYW